MGDGRDSPGRGGPASPILKLLGSLHLDLPENRKWRHHATGCIPRQPEWGGAGELSIPGCQAVICCPCPDSGTSLIMTETKYPLICGPGPNQNYTPTDLKGGQHILDVDLER